jgi:hypothetical protein
MKTFSKTFLPDTVEYNGQIYLKDVFRSAALSAEQVRLSAIQDEVKKEGRKMILVNVLSKNLKGKTDLHGRPYQPTKWIFTTNNTK